MIDTFKLIWTIQNHHILYMENCHGIKPQQVSSIIGNKHRGVSAIIRMGSFFKTFELIVNVPIVLGRGDIYEEDFCFVSKKIEGIVQFLFNDSRLYMAQNLTRIDYRIDVRVEDPLKREIYFRLFSKTSRKVFHLVKSQRGTGSRKYIVFKTSIYHKAKSLEAMVYDKSEERKARNKSAFSWEDRCIRFEVRLKNSHLKNKKASGYPKILETYFSSSLFMEYMVKYLGAIYLHGDYYTLEEAEKAVSKSGEKTEMKIKLKKFLKSVAAGDLTTPLKRMNRGTYRSRIRKFETLSLNPITIPQIYKGDVIFLPNLLKGKLEVPVQQQLKDVS